MAEDTPIKIKIKILGSEEEHELEVQPSLKIEALKELIHGFYNSSENLRLIFRGHSLKNGETLAFHHIEDGHTIIVVPSRKPESAQNSEPPPPVQPQNPNEIPQTPSLPPIAPDPICHCKKDIDIFQQSFAVLNESATKLQASFLSGDPETISNCITEYVQLNDQIFPQITPLIDNIKTKRFIFNNNRIELDPNYRPNMDTQRKPIKADILTQEDKDEIRRHISQLESYISSNTLYESYRTSNLYNAINFE